MYAIRIPGEVSQRSNEALRAYARLEFPREDVQWLLATARRVQKPKRAPRTLRLFTRRARPTHMPVAHKGSPRLPAGEGPSPA